MNVRDLVDVALGGDPLLEVAADTVTDHHFHTEVVAGPNGDLSILVTVEADDHSGEPVMRFLMNVIEAVEMGEFLARQGSTAAAMMALIITEREQGGGNRTVSPTFEVPDFSL